MQTAGWWVARWWIPAVLATLLTSCRPVATPVTPVVEDTRFVLRISLDGALALDGKPISRTNLAVEAGKLASRARFEAKLQGRAVEPLPAVPAGIVIEAAAELPSSVLLPLARECQSAGFGRWSFTLIPDIRNPPRPDRGRSPTSLRVEKSYVDLPLELQTLPIQVLADDSGKLARPMLEDREFPDLEALLVEFRGILADPSVRFDRVSLKYDGQLHCVELFRLIDGLASLKLNQVNLIELDARGAR